MSDTTRAATSGTNRDTVLVIEDDHDIALAMSSLLTKAGFDVQLAGDGRQGLRVFHNQHPDLVILDVGLPGLDGWQVLERLRDISTAPVLMLTAYSRESDRVRGLQSGADDYLTKPFSNNELVARVRALLRRARILPQRAKVYDDGVLHVDFVGRQVLVQGAEVNLTPLEFRLLGAFVRHAGQVLSPTQLLAFAWHDHSAVGLERVKFSVLRLRRKLGKAPIIQAVRGFGYRYLPPAT